MAEVPPRPVGRLRRRETFDVRPAFGSLQEMSEPERQYLMLTNPCRIGRHRRRGWFRRNNLVLDDPMVSRAHATLRAADGRFTLSDDGSRNHTYVNGEQLAAGVPHVICPGDILRIGGREYCFRAPGPDRRCDRDNAPVPVPRERDVLQCICCDIEVPPQQLVLWEGFRVCQRCEEDLLELPTTEIAAEQRRLDDRVRQRRTNGMR